MTVVASSSSVAAGAVAVEQTGIGHYSRPASVLAVVDDEQVALEIVVAVDAERHIGNVAAERRKRRRRHGVAVVAVPAARTVAVGGGMIAAD